MWHFALLHPVLDAALHALAAVATERRHVVHLLRVYVVRVVAVENNEIDDFRYPRNIVGSESVLVQPRRNGDQKQKVMFIQAIWEVLLDSIGLRGSPLHLHDLQLFK